MGDYTINTYEPAGAAPAPKPQTLAPKYAIRLGKNLFVAVDARNKPDVYGTMSVYGQGPALAFQFNTVQDALESLQALAISARGVLPAKTIAIVRVTVTAPRREWEEVNEPGVLPPHMRQAAIVRREWVLKSASASSRRYVCAVGSKSLSYTDRIAMLVPADRFSSAAEASMFLQARASATHDIVAMYPQEVQLVEYSGTIAVEAVK